MENYKQEEIRIRGRSNRLFRGGKGAPLLFLPDTFCFSWLPIHEMLSVHYEVFLPAHPGCAGSEDGFDQFDEIEDMVFHYLDFCEALHLDRPIVVGASFGGWVAAEWAIRYSQALGKLVLIDALGLRIPDAPTADILGIDIATVRRAIFADPRSSLALETIPDTPKSDDIVSSLLSRQTLARFAWQFPDDARLSRYLYRVTVPTLIIWGEGDGFVPLAHGKASHQGIAKSELVVIPTAGHLPHVEAADACAEAILNFLGKNTFE
jgi:pimeloyl-ACP methyl ester carboxylesterase